MKQTKQGLNFSPTVELALIAVEFWETATKKPAPATKKAPAEKK